MITTDVITRKRYRVEQNKKFRIKDWDASDRVGLPGETHLVIEQTAREIVRIEELQGRLHAEHKHKVLLVFQATDTGGKDGCIRRLASGMDPAGLRVTSYKAPSTIEYDHDPLWRIHPHVPGKGQIAIFNRSHYEDYLVPRVHKIFDEKRLEKRLRHLLTFEEMLADEGVCIIKFFLNIDKDEQKKRLLARQENPEKHWKFDLADLKERDHWDEYQKAYEDMLAFTSADYAPWYIIPANNKKRRDLVVATVVRKHLEDLSPQFPKAAFDVSELKIK